MSYIRFRCKNCPIKRKAVSKIPIKLSEFKGNDDRKRSTS